MTAIRGADEVEKVSLDEIGYLIIRAGFEPALILLQTKIECSVGIV